MSVCFHCLWYDVIPYCESRLYLLWSSLLRLWLASAAGYAHGFCAFVPPWPHSNHLDSAVGTCMVFSNSTECWDCSSWMCLETYAVIALGFLCLLNCAFIDLSCDIVNLRYKPKLLRSLYQDRQVYTAGINYVISCIVPFILFILWVIYY